MCAASKWDAAFAIAERLRLSAKPFAPGEFVGFVKELREDRNARPSWP